MKCFFPGKGSVSSFEDVDETFLTFIEEAVKSTDSSEQDLIELVHSVLPDTDVDHQGLSARIGVYRDSLLNKFEENSHKKNLEVNTSIFAAAPVFAVDEDRKEQLQQSEIDWHISRDLETLRGLCGIDDSSGDEVFLFLMSRVVLGDVEDTARWLVDHSFQEALEMKLADDRKRKEKEKSNAEGERLARERILQRFDEKAEPINLDMMNYSTRKPKTNNNTSESKVRYLDGKVVATNGAKYIEVSTKEDWDGGSRGRVKTKGKRGPGWVAN